LKAGKEREFKVPSLKFKVPSLKFKVPSSVEDWLQVLSRRLFNLKKPYSFLLLNLLVAGQNTSKSPILFTLFLRIQVNVNRVYASVDKIIFT